MADGLGLLHFRAQAVAEVQTEKTSRKEIKQEVRHDLMWHATYLDGQVVIKQLALLRGA